MWTCRVKPQTWPWPMVRFPGWSQVPHPGYLSCIGGCQSQKEALPCLLWNKTCHGHNTITGSSLQRQHEMRYLGMRFLEMRSLTGYSLAWDSSSARGLNFVLTHWPLSRTSAVVKANCVVGLLIRSLEARRANCNLPLLSLSSAICGYYAHARTVPKYKCTVLQGPALSNFKRSERVQRKFSMCLASKADKHRPALDCSTVIAHFNLFSITTSHSSSMYYAGSLALSIYSLHSVLKWSDWHHWQQPCDCRCQLRVLPVPPPPYHRWWDERNCGWLGWLC